MGRQSEDEFEIGELARRAGVRPSAVRYYEARGLIVPARRAGGRRAYGEEAVERLALISFAKKMGFSLDQVRELFDGFAEGTPPGARWTELGAAKLAELAAMSARIEMMRAALERIMRCHCIDLDECARGIAAHARKTG